MSAYVVDDETISRILSHKQGPPANGEERGISQMLGEAMREMNIAAVRARYEDADKAEMIPGLPYTFSFQRVTALQALKSLKCFLYQCSEGDIPERFTMYGELRDLEKEWALDIIQAMPEYEKAEWA